MTAWDSLLSMRPTSSARTKDQIYLGEETLALYKDALDVIERDSMRKRNDGTAREHLTPDGTAFVGAELFWYAAKTPQVHALNAAYYFAPDSSGLYLAVVKAMVSDSLTSGRPNCRKQLDAQ